MSSKTATRRRVQDASPAAASRNPASRRQLTSEPVTKAEAAEASSDNVLVTVPKGFRLVTDHHHHVDYQAGTYQMPRDHFDHWWSKANGVTEAAA